MSRWDWKKQTIAGKYYSLREEGLGEIIIRQRGKNRDRRRVRESMRERENEWKSIEGREGGMYIMVDR